MTTITATAAAQNGQTLLFIRHHSIRRPICLPSLHNICLTRTDIRINITKLCTNRTHTFIHKLALSSPASLSRPKMNDPRVLIKYWSASLLKYSVICQHEKRAEEYEFMTKFYPSTPAAIPTSSTSVAYSLWSQTLLSSPRKFIQKWKMRVNRRKMYLHCKILLDLN